MPKSQVLVTEAPKSNWGGPLDFLLIPSAAVVRSHFWHLPCGARRIEYEFLPKPKLGVACGRLLPVCPFSQRLFLEFD